MGDYQADSGESKMLLTRGIFLQEMKMQLSSLPNELQKPPQKQRLNKRNLTAAATCSHKWTSSLPDERRLVKTGYWLQAHTWRGTSLNRIPPREAIPGYEQSLALRVGAQYLSKYSEKTIGYLTKYQQTKKFRAFSRFVVASQRAHLGRSKMLRVQTSKSFWNFWWHNLLKNLQKHHFCRINDLRLWRTFLLRTIYEFSAAVGFRLNFAQLEMMHELVGL